MSPGLRFVAFTVMLATAAEIQGSDPSLDQVL